MRVNRNFRISFRWMRKNVMAQVRRRLGALGAAGTLAIAVSLAGTAVQAHSFSLSVITVGDDATARLESAVRGILLASQERDSHADEESDGHLGGLDVYIVAQPVDGAAPVSGLVGASPEIIDIAVVLGPDALAQQAISGIEFPTVAIRPGTITAGLADPGSEFATRYETAYGTKPNEAAIEGYNAARRVDLAVRPLGGAEDRDALIAALAETTGGIKW